MPPLSLLRLPFLPLQNIIQNWNIYEICQFAKVSKRTKSVARAAFRKPVDISLTNGECFSIQTSFAGNSGIVSRGQETWVFELRDISDRDNAESDVYNENHVYHTLNLFSENPLLLFLETLEFLFEVFDCSIHMVYWTSWKTEDMRQVIDWMNGCDKLTKIETVNFNLNVNNQMTLALFLETFKKKLGRLIVYSKVSDIAPVKFSIEMERFSYYGARWVNLSILMSMNTCKRLYLAISLLSNQDLKVFLRSWKEGKSNSILEVLHVYVTDQEDWKTVLNGLGAVVRHPTRVTRCYIKNLWYYGGVDIQRVDGKIGTVMWTHYVGSNEHEKIPRNIIEVFEKTKQEWVGTDSDVVFEEKGNEIQVSDEEKIIKEHSTQRLLIWRRVACGYGKQCHRFEGITERLLSSMSPLPLLRLPFLPLRNIIRNWNIYEIYHFAKVSKRTKHVARLAVRKPVKIRLENGESFVIYTSFAGNSVIGPQGPETWLFELRDISERDNTESDVYNENHVYHALNLFSENPLLLFLETLQLLFEVFDCSIHSVYWSSWKSEDMRQVIDWMNGCDKLTKIKNVNFSLNANNQWTLAFFLGRFQKKIGRVIMHSDVSDIAPLKFSMPLEIERFDYFGGAKWVNLSILMSMNTCKRLYLGVSLLSNQDLNAFLRSWKEGRSNPILEDLRVFIPGQEDWRTVLNGLGAVVRHPTQVARCCIEIFWFYGGVDIQRVDGTIGTVMWTHYLGKKEHEKIPKNVIEAFERTNEEWTGTDSDVVFEERGNVIQVSDEEKIIKEYLPTQCFDFTFVVWK
ncbi:hypothetical protein GCK72_003474 [Caenorhabditis remanei]|uniref:F-box domain-containing protein n=1 Tax=Caenorhabditis remanei TaxID=31234 RepID=A0A6A5HY98_CAERE|nr:hypothetical protein GCK72_003474 [Caenorhabditis remanei]KAF1771647.1 hypothetical protein GCK72_003474 [Caenorhabditis remanei]